MKRLLLRVFRKLGLDHSLNYSRTLIKNGSKFTIPLKGQVGYNHFFDPEDEWMNRLLNSLRKAEEGSNGSFVDVGVNIGQTLLKVKSIDFQWRYIGFEPNPRCVNYLSDLIVANKLEHVTIFPFALGEKTGVGQLELYSDDITDSSASVIPGFRSNLFNKVPIVVVDGKEINQYVKDVSIIKIDVEGGELEVLTGLKKTLLEEQPFVICEVLPVYSESNVRYKRQTELEKLVKECNYAIFRIDASANLIPLKEIGVNTEIEKSNYLFLPKSKIDAMRSVLTIHE